MKVYEIIEGIEEGCNAAINIAGCSIIATCLSGLIAARISSPATLDASIRVLKMATWVILPISLIGTVGSSWVLSRIPHPALIEYEKIKWRELLEVLEKDDSYCVSSCQNCKHLVGRIGLADYLICGMHPYGWQGSNCPDKEVCHR